MHVQTKRTCASQIGFNFARFGEAKFYSDENPGDIPLYWLFNDRILIMIYYNPYILG